MPATELVPWPRVPMSVTIACARAGLVTAARASARVVGRLVRANKLRNIAASSQFRLRQRREQPNAELPEVGDIDHAVVVEIERSKEAGLARVKIECRGKQTKVGDIDVPVAVDVAVEAEEALGIAEDEVAAGGAVGVAVQGLATGADLRCERGQRI